MVFTCRVHSYVRNQQCRGCLRMERSHDPIQTELLSRIERRERTEKCKFYTACIILIPLFTLFFAYVYFLLHDVQVSFVWILIFLACMLTLPFVVAFLGRLYQDLILNFLHAKKIFHYHICDGKVNQCHQVFHDMVKKRGLRLSDDVVRHILSFLPRLVRGRRKKSSHDRVFFRPRHIAIDTSADIAVVSESGKSRLRLMRADLSDPYLDQYLRIREVQNIPFVPEGIAVTSISHGGPWFEREIRIYVTDIVSHRVAMFDVEGRCVWCVGRKGNTPGRFNRPGGCSISNDGPLFVCDTGNNRVQVLCASTGRFLHTMGSEGHGKGRLLEPIDCAVDNKNRLFVVDSLNFRVQVFSTLNGSSLFMWGSRSSSVGGLWRPRCILVHRGFVYITEYDDHHSLCKVFEERTKKYVNSWLLGNNFVKDPVGIAANGENVYVVDHRGTVQVFY